LYFVKELIGTYATRRSLIIRTTKLPSLLLVFASMVVVTLTALSPTITTTVWADRIVSDDDGNNLEGTDGDDTILGLGGDDFIVGLGGNDRLVGGEGNNGQMNGFEGDDIIDGGSGDDFDLFGGEGNDRVSGGGGNDDLFGENGNDRLSGDAGHDRMFGGPGADEFACGGGVDPVMDFNAEEGDTKSGNCEEVGFVTISKEPAGPSRHDFGDFNYEVISENPVPGSPGRGNTFGLLPGQYFVHEIGESGGTVTKPTPEVSVVYEVTYSEGCSGTISAVETKACTVTNTAIEP
jgi:RTX calcium-binding nonapeptide repeat (4 copies)